MFSNTRTLRIEWGDCDPAGIVFYPRYFAMFDTSTTELMEAAIGMSKFDYLKAYQIHRPSDRRNPRHFPHPQPLRRPGRDQTPIAASADPASRSNIA